MRTRTQTALPRSADRRSRGSRGGARRARLDCKAQDLRNQKQTLRRTFSLQGVPASERVDRFTLSAAGERGWVDLACSAVAHALSRALDDDARHRRKRAGALPKAIRESVGEQHGTAKMMPLGAAGSQPTSSATPIQPRSHTNLV